jgi:hypothetical protein
LTHKQLRRKANDIIHKCQTKNTSLDKLRRNIEGLYIQLKNLTIFIFKQAGKTIKKNRIFNLDLSCKFFKKDKCKSRTRIRRVLTEVKQKALKKIEIINSKGEQNQISYDDFDNGVFPWERFQHEKKHRISNK